MEGRDRSKKGGKGGGMSSSMNEWERGKVKCWEGFCCEWMKDKPERKKRKEWPLL